jgi:dsDNA-specific endonuclease/ATPase MutS2
MRMAGSSETNESSGGEEGMVRLRVTGDLDLHHFRPRDLAELLPAWFEECRAAGIPAVRVIHGKGTGTLRAGVHALLPRLPDLVVAWSYPAPAEAGGWGATIVQLQRAPGPVRS